jgi:hypothetical protein
MQNSGQVIHDSLTRSLEPDLNPHYSYRPQDFLDWPARQWWFKGSISNVGAIALYYLMRKRVVGYQSRSQNENSYTDSILGPVEKFGFLYQNYLKDRF